MDFRNAKEISEVWSASDKTDFKLVFADDNERKLVFSYGAISFFVVCPEPNAVEPGGNWHVWSDSDDVLQYLHEVQEFLDCCKRSLTEILNKVNKSLLPLIGHAGAAESDGEMEEVDEDFDEAYYDDDCDVSETTAAEAFKHHSSSEEEEVCEYAVGNASPIAVKRILRDLKGMKEANGKFGVQGQPKDNNLFIWAVQLIDIPEDTLLGQDLKNYARKYGEQPVVQLEMKFPDDYPMAPPFVRIIKPRFKFLTGHVTIGGSVCMELLTRSGWSPTNDIEGILVQIRAEILSDSQTRLDLNANQPYDEVEARQAFERMVKKYNWKL